MYTLINTLEFFIIISVGLIGWVFACAFGINATIRIVERIKRDRNKIDGGF